jgi:hypothetical protein
MSNLKIKTYILVFFLGASLANSLTFQGENSLTSFFVGELIIFLFAYDLAKTKYKFHIYQILLCYFYYSLCLTNSFSGFSTQTGYYTWSYVICVTHFIFLAIGYNSIKYKHGTLSFFPKQNLIILIYFLAYTAFSLYQMNFESSGRGYKDSFSTSAEEARANISIVKYVYDYIVSELIIFSVLIFSNPLVWAVYSLIHGFLTYISIGVKAHFVKTCIQFLIIYQIYYKNFTTKQMLILLPTGLIALTILIGSTAFRGDLSLKSLMSLDTTTLISSAERFLAGAESRHIIYTADIIERIDKGEITYRYGFDFYRFILYPFKELFDNFGYASYVEYAALRAGKLTNSGQYLGLAGELYWNFGIFFFVFSYFMGLALKRLTNYAFSLKPFGVITYLLLIHLIVWRYYRGGVSDLMFLGILYFASAIVFFTLMKLFGLKFPRFGRKLVMERIRVR